MTREQMLQRLHDFYPNSKVEVWDLTGTEDHWEVLVESEKFKGMSRIQMHQDVMKAFAAELQTGEVHALSLKTKAV